VQQKLYKL